MKSKKMTYLLGIAVAVVWGLIVYRIVDAASGDDDPLPVSIAGNKTKEPYNDYAIPQDTTKLLLNYRDPFALKETEDTVVVPVNKIVHSSLPAPIKPAINWSFIKYGGFIKNPGSKKLIAIMTINGKSVMLAEGETAERVKLLKNLKDSIKITFNGNTKFITINSAAL